MAYRGNRCQICTGCGRCAPAGRLEEDMQVITKSYQLPGKLQSDREQSDREQSDREQPDRLQPEKLQSDREQPDRLQPDRLQPDRLQPEEAQSEKSQSEKSQQGKLQPDKQQAGVEADEFMTADLGTTTIAMEWYDRWGKKQGEYVKSNPQRVFGTDVISRIQTAENPLLRRQMQQVVQQVFREGVEKAQQQGASPKRIIVAGNTTMMYLLLGHDPAQLGTAPFTADYLSEERINIGDMEIITLPGLSAFIGGDILGGILACEMDMAGEVSLLVDLGTNGELVLGNREKLLACGTAAGPAFEGGSDIWGADMIALTARLQELGLVDETGLLADPYFETGVTIGDVRITQERIRQLQTAKAAICAGIGTLIDAYGLTGPEQVKQVYLAGGFGYFLDVKAAISLGLLPQGLEGRVKAVGNTALAGAYLYGRESDSRERVDRIREITRVMNLAEQQGFGTDFVEAMYLRRG